MSSSLLFASIPFTLHLLLLRACGSTDLCEAQGSVPGTGVQGEEAEHLLSSSSFSSGGERERNCENFFSRQRPAQCIQRQGVEHQQSRNVQEPARQRLEEAVASLEARAAVQVKALEFQSRQSVTSCGFHPLISLLPIAGHCHIQMLMVVEETHGRAQANEADAEVPALHLSVFLLKTIPGKKQDLVKE